MMQRIAEGGIEITALHNHLLRSTPATMYMHIEGRGDPIEAGRNLHGALGLSKTPARSAALCRRARRRLISTPQLWKTFWAARARRVAASTSSASRALSRSKMAAWMFPLRWGQRLQSTSSPPAGARQQSPAILLLTAPEVNPVLRALKTNGIEVTAIHNHMLNEEPRLFFMHFWANDDATKLAKGIRAALDQVNTAKM